MSKRICPIHGIWEKTDTVTRCPKCAPVANRAYDQKRRNKDSDKFYHSLPWKRVRGLQLSRFPLCAECGRPGNIVDHIVEIRDGGEKLSLSNLQTLCTACHNTKTAREKSKRGGRGKSLQPSSPNTEPPPKLLQSTREGGTP